MKVIPIGHNWVRMLEYGILVNWLPKRKKKQYFLYKYLNEPESQLPLDNSIHLIFCILNNNNNKIDNILNLCTFRKIF